MEAVKALFPGTWACVLSRCGLGLISAKYVICRAGECLIG